jgi:hypothetical protein
VAREWYDTVANVVSDAAIELGLVSAAIADPYGSSNAHILLLNALLKGLGQDMHRGYDWQQLLVTATLSLSGGFQTLDSSGMYFDLPAGFDRMLNETQWNRTTRFPLAGPVSPQGWEMLKAIAVAAVVYLPYRIVGDQICFNITATQTATIAYEYVSRYWVQPAAQLSPTAETPTLKDDVLYFDRRLLVQGLKYRFKSAKGFDVAAAKAEFDDALEAAKANNIPAATLSLNGPQEPRMLDRSNLPDTGYGS